MYGNKSTSTPDIRLGDESEAYGEIHNLERGFKLFHETVKKFFTFYKSNIGMFQQCNTETHGPLNGVVRHLPPHIYKPLNIEYPPIEPGGEDVSGNGTNSTIYGDCVEVSPILDITSTVNRHADKLRELDVDLLDLRLKRRCIDDEVWKEIDRIRLSVTCIHGKINTLNDSLQTMNDTIQNDIKKACIKLENELHVELTSVKNDMFRMQGDIRVNSEECSILSHAVHVNSTMIDEVRVQIDENKISTDVV